MEPIELSEVHKHFGNVTAVDGLSLTVSEGEFFGLLGPNGAGKTTTMNLLTGHIEPDEGAVSVFGRTPTECPIEVRQTIGVLPEKQSPPSFLTPREYLTGFVSDARGLDQSTAEAKLDEWADRLEYGEKLDTLCADLSRGQQQKVMVTQAFIHEPSLVLIDEPLANLDPIMQERVKSHLQDYHARGNSLVLSTHHIEVASELCDRIGFVVDGEIVEQNSSVSEDDLLGEFVKTVDRDGDSE